MIMMRLDNRDVRLTMGFVGSKDIKMVSGIILKCIGKKDNNGRKKESNLYHRLIIIISN
jgi:hypothetical protein